MSPARSASWQCIASAADPVEQVRRETLGGLTGIVVWTGVPSEMINDGLTDTQLKTDVEVRLRRAGVQVLEIPSQGSGTLIITVGGSKSRELGVYAVSIKVQLIQGIQVLQNNARSIGETRSVNGFTG